MGVITHAVSLVNFMGMPLILYFYFDLKQGFPNRGPRHSGVKWSLEPERSRSRILHFYAGAGVTIFKKN